MHLVPKTGGGGGGGGLGGGGLGGRGGGFGLGLGGGGGHGGGAPVRKVLLLHCGCTHSLPFSTGKLLLQPKMSEPLLMDHEMPCVDEARLPRSAAGLRAGCQLSQGEAFLLSAIAVQCGAPTRVHTHPHCLSILLLPHTWKAH